MSNHLLVMSLGPVQGFIAQARRTRDLWFSSHVLSELSRQAAAATQALGAELIFPVLPGGLGAASEPETVRGIPNKLLVLVRGREPRDVARAARDAARTHLRDWGLRILQARSQLVDPAAHHAAQEQLDTFLEFHAAWSPLATESEYCEALRRVEAALAERKRVRTFTQWTCQRGGVHKSSLDGGRETVLRECEQRGGDWERFRIGRREQLDAIGLLKRTGGNPGQFIPVPSIGLAAYTSLAQEKLGSEMEALNRECERLGRHLTRVTSDSKEWVRNFPFDAQLLLPGRWSTHLVEQGLEREQANRFGETYVRPLLRKLGAPFPYVACLAADGDKMGEMLQALARHGHSAHQRMSRALSGFATEVRRIVEEKHRGVLVYAGGDDVLAFVCLPDALGCAAELRQAFTAAIREALTGTGVPPPTLSVGLGVGHVLESLGDLLALGRRAEMIAKAKDRDGLALLARLHSGREHSWRGRWSDSQPPVEVLENAISLREKGLPPLKKVQEVGALVRRMPPGTVPPEESKRWGRVLTWEVHRVLGRVDMGMGEVGRTPEEVGLELSREESLSLETVRERVEAWTERLFLAELFARAKPRLLEKDGGAA